MRRLATIRKVDEIRPIEGADAIELAVFGGWQVVVRKAQEIRPGMPVVYCEIDSVFPEQPQYEFLRQDKFRLRTKKFRGAVSQGIVFKIDEVLPAGQYAAGDEVTGTLGITLFEPPIPASIAGEVAGTYPGSVPKTDEERVQNLALADLSGISFFVTEKVDGTSGSFILDGAGLHVCGRNWEFHETPEQTFWKLARHYDIEAKLRAYHARTGSYLAVQGEVLGYGIQSNVYGLKGQDIFIFNIFDITRQRYLSAMAYRALLDEFGLKGVPVVATLFSMDGYDHAKLLAYAEGKSLLNQQAEREGVVFRSRDETSSNQGKISFKAISNKYLLKHGG
jgi:RNA ligase (TIGR02306 family)